MKTRVVRYWLETDWLYKVEGWREATCEEMWVMTGGVANKEFPGVKAGEWYWSHIAGCLSHDKAMEIAEKRAASLHYDATDVVAEFGS
jgi:hypothetical protein